MHAKDFGFAARWERRLGLTPERYPHWYGSTRVRYCDGSKATPPIDMDRETAKSIYDDVLLLRQTAVKDHADNQAVQDAICLLQHLQRATVHAAVDPETQRVRPGAWSVMEALHAHLDSWMTGNDRVLGASSFGSLGEPWEMEQG